MKSKQKTLNSKTKMSAFDITISIVFLAISTGFFIYSLCINEGFKDWTLYVSFFASVLTLFNWIYTIKKMIINAYFGAAWAILNGAIAIAEGLLGNILRFLAINLPMQIVSLVIWYRNSSNKKTVETRKCKPKPFWIIIACTLAITAVWTYFETQAWFCDPLDMTVLPWYEALADAIGFTFSITTAIFFIGRYNQYWVATSIASISGLVLWLARAISNPTDVTKWQMVISSVINMVFCTKGIIEWYGLKTRQNIRKGK